MPEPSPFEPSTVETIRALIAASPAASLGTLDVTGHPFVTLVTFAATGPSSVAMLLSGLAKHSKYLDANAHASLLVASVPDGEDPMTSARVTLTGTVTKLSRESDADVRAAFLTKHSSAAMYADFGDFSFYEFKIKMAHLIAGFGRIETVDGRGLLND